MLTATHKLNHSCVALSVVWAVERNVWNDTIQKMVTKGFVPTQSMFLWQNNFNLYDRYSKDPLLIIIFQ